MAAVVAFLGGWRTRVHDRTEREKQVAHDRAQHQLAMKHDREERGKQMKHDRLERIRACQLEAADVFLSAASRSQMAYTARAFALEEASDERLARDMQERVTEGLRFRNEAASAVARLTLLFGTDSDTDRLAQELVRRLVELGNAAEDTNRAFQQQGREGFASGLGAMRDRLRDAQDSRYAFCRAVERATNPDKPT